MYSIFKQLLEENNLTPYKVSKDTGISTATLSDWKNKKSTPKSDKIKKIADYFGVTTDYLLGREQTDFLPQIQMSDKEKEVMDIAERIAKLPPEAQARVDDYLDLLLLRQESE